MKKMHVLQHEHFEGTANIGRWAVEQGYELSHTRLYKGEVLPKEHEYNWLVIMGGTMGVYQEDRFPWLVEEKKFVRKAIESGRKVLGVCLGAQLIASALGAPVFPGPEKEIGWFPVQRTNAGAHALWFAGVPESFITLHWHGDTFDLPSGAVQLASSAAYQNQAFQYGASVLALQFHLELAPEDVKALCEASGMPEPRRWVQGVDEILLQTQHFEANRRLLTDLLKRMDD